MAHTDEEIRVGLTALVVAGTAAGAERLIEQSGLPAIPYRTLARWRHRHADLFREIAQEHAPKIEADLIGTYRAVSLKAAELTGDLIDKTRQQMEQDELKDPASAARNIATAGAIANDKLLVHTDRPNNITEKRGAEQILRSLSNLIPGFEVVDSTAEEIPSPMALGSAEREEETT